MGPVMPPSKKPECSGVGVASGLSPLRGTRSLTRTPREAEEMEPGLAASRPERPHMDDEELTNLNWLHESKNLLNSFGDPVLRSVSPLQELEDDGPPSPVPCDPPHGARHSPNCKPPYSFSCLIFMAIEDAPAKRLPVKDIYSWILEHFPYFASAPTGWKNSVRHNLSLNKCFKKVDKDRSQSSVTEKVMPSWRAVPVPWRDVLNLGRSCSKLGCINGHRRVSGCKPTMISLVPLSLSSMSSPPLWPGSPFFRKNGEVLLPVPQGVIQNGARIVSQGLFPGIRSIPINPIGTRTAIVRSVLDDCRKCSDSEPSCDSPLVSSDPKEDHTYSSAKSSNPPQGGSPCPHGQAGAPRGDTGSDADDVDSGRLKKEPADRPADGAGLAQHKKRQQWTRMRTRCPSESLPLKKRHTEKPPESDDEEMKEAAGSLLHLAGVRACLNNITNRAAKGQKETLKN
nr:forkhead box protein N3 [Paramormyrops kingsleyae]